MSVNVNPALLGLLNYAEEKGLIEKLDTDEYRITDEGRLCLKTWKWTLREYADTVRALSDEIDL